MHLTDEDQVAQQFLILKGCGAKRLIKEFPTKDCKKTTRTIFKATERRWFGRA